MSASSLNRGGPACRVTHTAVIQANGTMLALACLASLAASPAAQAQSLFLRPVEVVIDENGLEDHQASLRLTSLLFIDPPKPRTYKIHDQITIIVDETSRSSSKQTLDTKKDYSLDAGVTDFPNLEALLDGRVENGESSPDLGLTSNQKFKGEGTYDRSDRFNARITATIIDVKPNGVLVLEARKIVQRDEEVTTLTLSGRARTEDVTSSNTVLSSQLAELTLSSANSGQVKDASTKGIIPRILEAIFNF
ncbi:MAG: flagellar basal body L-ring protein FlgH [Planctomycetota bacterium]|nr:flagellar basal body L-ring protein FlgH [Planctomycetota bacterium]